MHWRIPPSLTSIPCFLILEANPAEDFPRSSTAAREALRLDPTLAHPHAILGSIEMEYDWDFSGGEAEFRKAFALDPNDATAHQWFAENLGMIGGREQEALVGNRPGSSARSNVAPDPPRKGSVLVAARRYDDAIAVCQQLLAENPTYNLAHDCLGYAYWETHVPPGSRTSGNLFRHSGNRDYADLAMLGTGISLRRLARRDHRRHQFLSRPRQTSYVPPLLDRTLVRRPGR